MIPRFVIQGLRSNVFLHVDGKKFANHPIGAKWFWSREEADNLLRREFSRSPNLTIRQLTEDCSRVRL